MTSHLYPYIQESINLNSKNTDNYIMTIQYSLDGLSFVIFDTAESKFIALKHYHLSDKDATLEELILELQERESWRLDNFKKVNILIDTKDNTLIPKEFYNEELSNEYLETLQISSTNVAADTIDNSICNIYPIDDYIVEAAKNISKNINIKHASTIFISNLIKDFSQRTAETRAFVNVKNNYYELCVLDNDKLIFHNYFNFNTKEDFLYFILFTFEQLKIDNETIPLYFMGFIENNSSIVNLCSRYIRNIRFINRDNNIKYVSELNTIPYYYYYTLYNSVSCE